MVYGMKVFVKPVSPSLRVQRAEGLYGSFLDPVGQEAVWDSFLERRLQEGVITVEPIDPVDQEVA